MVPKAWPPAHAGPIAAPRNRAHHGDTGDAAWPNETQPTISIFSESSTSASWTAGGAPSRGINLPFRLVLFDASSRALKPRRELTLKLIGSWVCSCFLICGCRTLDCPELAGEGAQLQRGRCVTNGSGGMASGTRTSSHGVASGGSSCREPHQHLHPRTVATPRLNPHPRLGRECGTLKS